MKLHTKLWLSTLGVAALLSGGAFVSGLSPAQAQAAAPTLTSSCVCDHGYDLGSNNQIFSCQCGPMQCVVSTRNASSSPASPQLFCK